VNVLVPGRRDIEMIVFGKKQKKMLPIFGSQIAINQWNPVLKDFTSCWSLHGIDSKHKFDQIFQSFGITVRQFNVLSLKRKEARV
jgi:hypothetical protein